MPISCLLSRKKSSHLVCTGETHVCTGQLWSAKTEYPGRIASLNGNGKSASNPALLAAALNALTQSVAIIDARGLIVAVNDTWRRYAEENGMRWPRMGSATTTSRCWTARPKTATSSLAQIALGIRRVLAGSASSYRAEYACETLAGCYFVQHVTAFDFGGARHADRRARKHQPIAD